MALRLGQHLFDTLYHAVALHTPGATLVTADKRYFKPTIAALVTDEALRGCGIVTLSGAPLGPDTECMVRVGNLPPLRSQIRWVKELTAEVRRAGVMFLE